MNLRVSVILVLALMLSACASHTRSEINPQPSAPVTGVPAEDAAAPASAASVKAGSATVQTGSATSESPQGVKVIPSNRVSPDSSGAASAWPPHLIPEPEEIPAVHIAKRSPATHAPSIAPPRWDAAAYRRDPQAYLDEAFPGRANQTAQPAADVAFLLAEGPTGFRVAPLSRVALRARGEPWMPVTFTSLGLGTFLRNGLTTVSVPANADGLAQATWVATAGTIGSVSILAGSPTRAGQVSYLIQIAE